jgi:methylenetetrahydrofolate dehydrogenase (NADP+)/methenyltetrahydrofolate cyclohydrolase
MEMLKTTGIELRGKEAVVVGRSNIVGKPIALLLLQAGATVTLCHSQTRELAHHTRRADILVCAVGKLHMIGGDMVKSGAVVIDVGMNRNAEGKLAGDVDYGAALQRAGWITPVPGGVGPMTVAMLLGNAVLSAERHAAEQGIKLDD